jgi:hypothetical protein
VQRGASGADQQGGTAPGPGRRLRENELNSCEQHSSRALPIFILFFGGFQAKQPEAPFHPTKSRFQGKAEAKPPTTRGGFPPRRSSPNSPHSFLPATVLPCSRRRAIAQAGLPCLLLGILQASSPAKAISGFTGSFAPDDRRAPLSMTGPSADDPDADGSACSASQAGASVKPMACLHPIFVEMGSSQPAAISSKRGGIDGSQGKRIKSARPAGHVAAAWSWANASVANGYLVSLSFESLASAADTANTGRILRARDWIAKLYTINRFGTFLSRGTLGREAIDLRLDNSLSPQGSVYKGAFNPLNFQWQRLRMPDFSFRNQAKG